METKQPLIVLTGPTAVGKTALSIRLAKEIGGEIVSADSMQVYCHMNIGTAKITAEEMQGVPHYLIDELMPDEEFHVVRFQEMAKKAISEIYAKGKIPILSGGTGFYIQAILYDVDFTETEEDTEFRIQMEAKAREQGNHVLYERLKKVDPKSAEIIHANNIKRVIRALEYYEKTGKPISEHNEVQHEKTSAYNSAYFVLNMPRELLYERINQRVDKMFEDGLVREVQQLRDMGCKREMVSMQGIGYKEIFSYLDGEISLEEARYIIKRDTRHFAKRQLTWFRRERDVHWLDMEEYLHDSDSVVRKIVKICKEQGILL